MPVHGAESSLPAQPQLRGDAAILVPGTGDLRIAASPRHVVTVANAPEGLADWLLALDGTSSLADALAAAPVDASQARYLLAELDRAGLLADADGGLLFSHPKDPAAYRTDALRLVRQTRVGAPHRRGSRPTTVRTAVAGSPRWTARMRQALDLPGISLCDTDADAGAELLIIVGDAFDPGLEAMSARAMAQGTPHTCTAVSGVDALLLPLTVPGSSACPRCWTLQHDMRADWPTWTLGGRRPAPPYLPVHLVALVTGLVVEHALALMPALEDADHRGTRVERRLDLRRGTVQLGEVRPHPACGCVARAA